MKRIFALLFSLYVFVGSSFAEKVSEERAIRMAAEACGGISGKDFRQRASSVVSVSTNGTICYYIVQFQPEGWALVAADDHSEPVLGYSSEGVFEQEAMPNSMKVWLDGYAKKILANKQNLVLHSHPKWENPSYTLKADGVQRIEPIIQVNWNQSGAYAQYCPVNNEGKRALVGCVAVAMAQAMSVVRYPVHPVGQIAYEDDDMGLVKVVFDKEPDYDWEQILSGAGNKSEVARLLFHCGAALRMDYGVNASGAYLKNVPKSLKTYFSYPKGVAFYVRDSYQGDWKALILGELQEGRPVVYSGYDPMGSYGHAFNLDGYDGSNSFHINWGWGGKNNGYFSLDNLRDGKYDYRDAHQVVVGLKSEEAIGTAIEKLAGVVGVKVFAMKKQVVLLAEEVGDYAVYSISGTLYRKSKFGLGETRLTGLPSGGYVIVILSNGKRFVYKVRI